MQTSKKTQMEEAEAGMTLVEAKKEKKKEKGDVEVVLVALMCVSMTHRLCVGCCVWAVSLLPHH